MNLREHIQRARKTISPQEQLPNEMVVAFLRVLEETDDEELSCQEIFDKLDQYVDREVDKKDAARLMPLFRDHFDLCPDCCEEYEALLTVIEKMDEK